MPALTARHVFLTGQPGVGKTTLACAAVGGVPIAAGFYTRERRSATGERLGFDIITLGADGATGPLASIGRGKAMVGKYAVDTNSFERLALPSLDAAESAPITLIDEVGKMELFSALFLPRVDAILDGASTVLGTLPMPRYGHTIAAVERLRARADVAVVKLSKANRDSAAAAMLGIVQAAAARGRPGEPLDVSALVPYLQEGQEEKLRAGAAGAPAEVAPAPMPPLLPCPPAASTASAPALIGEAPHTLLLGETASAAPAPGELPYAERSMWPVLRLVFGLPEEATLAATQAAVTARGGVAIWDVLANVHERAGRHGRKRGGAADAERRKEQMNDVPALLAAHPSIRRIGFIGAKAKTTFERHVAPHREGGQGCEEPRGALDTALRGIELHVLPSSSRANTQPLAAKAKAWARIIHGDTA